jgi:glycosyltransferase involved in cell wall biosynthesis
MKILIINSRFFLSAGPEKYMFGIIPILEKHGHEVIPFSVKHGKNKKNPYMNYFAEPIGGADKVYFEDYNKNNPKTIYQMVERQVYSIHVRKRLKKLIKDTKPDVAYILHHYSKLSPSIIDACKESGLPVVLRLSDFFLACPEGHLLRNNLPCEECLGKSLFPAVKYKCVKNAFLPSFVKAGAIMLHRWMKIYDKVDYIISPSQFTISKMRKVLHARMVHIPTFVYHNEKYNAKVGKYALFVGRVEPEKGLLWAIKAFESTKYNLKIVGDSHSGYDEVLKDYVKEHGLKNIEFIGPKFGADLKKLYKNSRFFIMPNVWYENMPNVVLEAMSHSKPILTSDLGSMKEIVQNNYNGFLVKPNDVIALRDKIKLFFKDDKLCRVLGRNSFNDANKKYNPEKHYQRLIAIFKKVISENQK